MFKSGTAFSFLLFSATSHWCWKWQTFLLPKHILPQSIETCVIVSITCWHLCAQWSGKKDWICNLWGSSHRSESVNHNISQCPGNISVCASHFSSWNSELDSVIYGFLKNFLNEASSQQDGKMQKLNFKNCRKNDKNFFQQFWWN